MTVLRPNSSDLADRLGALRVGPKLLAAGDPAGPLCGMPIVVKDLIDVEGITTGAGNPDYLADAHPAPRHAPAVASLLAAGAAVIGKAHTDELAFSLSGTNVHYGTPVNPAAPNRVPGGSSSGSASAVAGGLVPAALGTDTGGSIRVPASYCGIFGLRPTHGRVSLAGVVEFAPSFGTVGLLASSGPVLATAGRALLGSTSAEVDRVDGGSVRSLVLATDLLEEADREVGTAVEDAARTLGDRMGTKIAVGRLQEGRLNDWLVAFRGRQLVEAWSSHGEWIRRRRPRLGPGIGARFDQARRTSAADAVAAGGVGVEVRAALDALLPPGGVMVIPSAATVAPPADLGQSQKDDLRRRTLSLTCIAGLGGLPAVSLPLASSGGLPVGVCLVGRPNDDEVLLSMGAAL